MTDNLNTLREIFPGYYRVIIDRLPGDIELQSILDDLIECQSIIFSDNFKIKSIQLREQYQELYVDLKQEVVEHINK
jgi:hypothetical protein